MWAALFVVAALAVGACREDDPNETGGKAEPTAKQDGARRADPSIQALSAACTAYWKTVLAELPPSAPDGYSAYLQQRRQKVETFIAAVRAQQSKGTERARLLAAGSSVLSLISNQQVVWEGDRLNTLFTGMQNLSDLDRDFVAAAKKAGVTCSEASEPSASLQEFRRGAAEACEKAGRPDGLPARDADVIRNRVAGHADLALPDTATELERETLAAERKLAKAAANAKSSPVILDADADYLALATRTTAGWSLQGVLACADLPTGN